MLEKNKKREDLIMKKVVIVENKGCVICLIGVVCLVDGFIFDFEIVGVIGLFGLWG